MLSTVRPPSALERSKLVTLIADSKWHHLFLRETTTKCLIRSLNIMLKTTEENLIVCSGKSEATITLSSSRMCVMNHN